MRLRIIVCSVLCAALVGLLGGAASTPADEKPPQKADRERIQTLIDKLGSSVFEEREAASQELEKSGPAALELLRKATKSADLEVRRRAQTLVGKVETRLLTEKMLAPKQVRVAVKDVPVPEAVAELAKLSGYPVEITGDSKALIDRKITLDTGKTTFWAALEQLCQKADLHHLVPVQPEPANAPGGRVGQGGKVVINIGNLPKAGAPLPVKPNPVQPLPAGPQPEGSRSRILLADGRIPERPTHLAGSVRIRAVPDAGKANVSTGEARLVLDASAEPRLRDFGIIAAPVIEKAVDDQGQVLRMVPAPVPAPQNPNPGVFGGNGVAVVNGQVFINGQPVGGNVPNVPKHRSVPVLLKRGEKPARTLKELSGALIVQALTDEPEALVTVDNILKAAGTKVKGKEEHQLEVVAVEKLADGDIKIQLALQRPGGQNPLGKGAFNNVAVINGQVMINGQPLGAGGVGPSRLSPQEYPKLTDAKGASHAPVSGRELTGKTTYELIYRLPAEPAQLVFYGQRPCTFAVPFTLKNVPLP